MGVTINGVGLRKIRRDISQICLTLTVDVGVDVDEWAWSRLEQN